MRWVLALLTVWACFCDGAEPVRIAARGQELTILFGGDIAFGENYVENRKQLLRQRGYHDSLERLKPLMERADFSILNLETPVCRPLPSPLEGKKKPLHWGHVAQTPATLQAHGVRLVSLGNNHGFDYGAEGLRETFDALRRHQIDWVGAGADREEAARPWVAELNLAGRRQYLAVLGGFEYQTPYRKRYDFYATDGKAGVARLELAVMRRQIASLKAVYPDIFVVVFPHWGFDYAWKSLTQSRLGHCLVEAGADLIIGHGAHRFQEIESYHQSWILYGLGNFVFNTTGRYAETGAPPYSLVALLTFRKSDTRLKLYPILSDNTRTGYQPRPLEAAEFAEAVRLLGEKNPLLSFSDGKDDVGRYIEWPLKQFSSH